MARNYLAFDQEHFSNPNDQTHHIFSWYVLDSLKQSLCTFALYYCFYAF